MYFSRAHFYGTQRPQDRIGALVICRNQAPAVVHVDGQAPGLREIPGLRREALLEGLDDIELTLKPEAMIAAHQERDRRLRPWIYEPVKV